MTNKLQPGTPPSEERASVLRALVESYSQPLTRYFTRRAPAVQDVPDLVQEVFLRLSRLDDPANIRHQDRFIFVTAANVLRDRARHNRSIKGQASTELVDELHLESSEIPQDRVLESKQVGERVRQALEELPVRTRDVFVLRMIDGMKMADIAAAMKISTRAAEKHQARALAHVADRMKGWRRD